MSDTKIFSLGDQSAGGSMPAILASLCQNRGLDPNMVAAMMNNRGNGWGDSAWWIIILLIFGWGGFGGGYGFNGRGNGQGLADLGSLVNSDAGRQLVLDAIGNNRTAISQLATTLNCDVNALQASINNISQAVCGIGNQVGMSGQQIINAILQGNNSLASQLAQCCCDNKFAISQQTNVLQNALNFNNNSMERGFSSLGYATAQQTCELKGVITDQTAQILAGQRAAEMREMQDKLDALRERNTALAGQLSQEHQTAQFGQMISGATAPLANALNEVSGRLSKLECKAPETVTVPYSPVAAIPNCVAAQYGLYGLGTIGNGFWG